MPQIENKCYIYFYLGPQAHFVDSIIIMKRNLILLPLAGITVKNISNTSVNAFPTPNDPVPGSNDLKKSPATPDKMSKTTPVNLSLTASTVLLGFVTSPQEMVASTLRSGFA